MKVAILGVKELKDRLYQVAKQLKSSYTPLQRAGSFLMRDAKANINKSGALYNTGGFKALSASTQKDRKNKGYNPKRPIMVRSGKLKNRFRYNVGAGQVTVDNETKYWKYHQKGGRKIPQRRLIGIRVEGVLAIRKYFVDELNRIFKIVFK